MATLWENIHSHTVRTHLNCSTTCKCTWFSFRDKACPFNLSLHQKTKKKGQHLSNKRGTYFERGNTQLLELFITCSHKMFPALVCTCLKCILQSSQSSIYHEWATLHGCKACMWDTKPFACRLECSYVVFFSR